MEVQNTLPNYESVSGLNLLNGSARLDAVSNLQLKWYEDPTVEDLYGNRLLQLMIY